MPKQDHLKETLIEVKENAIRNILKGCDDLGWHIVVSNAEDKDGFVDGLVIGTNDYIARVLTVDEKTSSDIYLADGNTL